MKSTIDVMKRARHCLFGYKAGCTMNSESVQQLIDNLDTAVASEEAQTEACPDLANSAKVTHEHRYMVTNGVETCLQCGVNRKNVPVITVAGIKVQADSDWGLALQRAREDAGFHWRDENYFKRLTDGSVRIRQFYQWNYCPSFKDMVIPVSEWSSIIASVSAFGDSDGGWERALGFHNGPVEAERVPMTDVEIEPIVRSALSAHMQNYPAFAKNACVEVAYEVARSVLAVSGAK